MFSPVELLLWAEEHLNHPHTGLEPQACFWRLFEQSRTGEPPEGLSSVASPALLVVLTTFHRPGPCGELIDELSAALGANDEEGVHLLVVHDHSNADYAPVRERAERHFVGRLSWLDARQHLGKAGYWRVYQAAFGVARQLRPKHLLFLQDDLQLAPDFMSRLWQAWRATEADPKRRVLYLFASEDDERYGRWTFFTRRDVPGQPLRKTQWFDLQAFFADRAFLELLGYQMVPIHPNRWRRRRSLSSGVGRQLTRRLRLRANVYQAFPPLVFHGEHESEMNPEARRQRALRNRDRK